MVCAALWSISTAAGSPDFYQRSKRNRDTVHINNDVQPTPPPATIAPESDKPMIENPEQTQTAETPQVEEKDFGTPSLVTLRTLYLQDHGIVLRCEDDHLRITKDDDELLNLPSFKIDQIMLMGNGMITTPAMKFCLRNNISIVLLSGSGQFEGIIESTGNQNVLLQKRQFERSSDDQFGLEMARRYVAGKIGNYRALLQRRHRSDPDDRLESAISSLQNILRDLAAAGSIDQIRGYEGLAALNISTAWHHAFKAPSPGRGAPAVRRQTRSMPCSLSDIQCCFRIFMPSSGPVGFHPMSDRYTN
ncbi:MAG: CRISPR-associated endonuclease Cas1 [Acidobacteria bacterium]|nr:CRISPR-associated endonuclease Cas1 [Acidobacteriota bacterium]